MPEAKVLSETLSPDHQPFDNNFFCLSVGYGITMMVVMFVAVLNNWNSGRGF